VTRSSALSIQSALRVGTDSIVHPEAVSASRFRVSCATFLHAVRCQLPPSTSTARRCSTSARSMLNLSIAKCSTGSSPALRIAANRSASYRLASAFFCLASAIRHRCSLLCRRPVKIARLAAEFLSRSSYDLRDITSRARSEPERSAIPSSAIQRSTVTHEQPIFRAISTEDMRSLEYMRLSSRRGGRRTRFGPASRRWIPYVLIHRRTVVCPTPSLSAMAGPLSPSVKYRRCSFDLGQGVIRFMARAYHIFAGGTSTVAPVVGRR